MVSKELLDVAVEAGGLEEVVAQQDKSVLRVWAHRFRLDQRLTVPNAVRNLSLCVLRVRLAVNHACSDDLVPKNALVVIDDQYVARVKLDGADDAGGREGDIGLQAGEVNLIAFLYVQAAHVIGVHARIQAFVDEKTSTYTRRTRGSLVADIVDAVCPKAMLV